ncbi:hypothetical protein [Hymenobacter cheonanensis]|uniref:hypothetical protein n=1 Tax=Hymenobacter sp. CA2-7 TaxID=3063993 RepID=UPI00271401B9|nr:hypothetical protein [Hymenobacter sp. CA2-7]MDO7883861.1 hypothetical protein [Hymenobacter sp. CA2-7]
MRFLFLLCSSGLALSGCETRQSAVIVTARPRVAAPTSDSARVWPAKAPAAPDTADYTRAYQGSFESPRADTLILLGKRQYWLQLRQVADSTKPLDYAPAYVVGRPFAAPSDTAWRAHRVRGYEGTYTFTLRDSARRSIVFRKRLHKRDFQAVAAGEVLTVSEPQFRYLGYSAGLNGLLFIAYFGIPYSDVVDRTMLLLDARTGQVKAQRGIGSATFDAIDCDPQVAPTGLAVLTCAGEVLRAGQPPLSLRRPRAKLRAARFLTDTTLLAVYEFGTYQPVKQSDTDAEDNADSPPVAKAAATAEMTQRPAEFVSTPAQRRAANAFVLSTSGRVLGKFRYDGWAGEMGYAMPRCFSPITRTYYFSNGGQSVFVLPKAQPGHVTELPLKKMSRFRYPQRSQEIKLILPYAVNTQSMVLYIDTLHPQQVRYRLQPPPEG